MELTSTPSSGMQGVHRDNFLQYAIIIIIIRQSLRIFSYCYYFRRVQRIAKKTDIHHVFLSIRLTLLLNNLVPKELF